MKLTNASDVPVFEVPTLASAPWMANTRIEPAESLLYSEPVNEVAPQAGGGVTGLFRLIARFRQIRI